jgi:hypothetical protein
MELLMMKPHVPYIVSAVLLAALLLLSSCTSLTGAAGKILEGKIDYTVTNYRSAKSVPKGRGYQVIERAGTSGRGLDIIIESMPAITLKASLPEKDGAFTLKSLDFLAGNPSGWVEFSLELSGEGNFVVRDAQNANLRFRPPVQPVRISAAKIRRTGLHLSGEDAILALNNRYERITALSEWMREREVPREVTRNLKNFEAYWKPFLLPELVEAERRPKFYDDGKDARWVTAELVKWNLGYTERILPEELRPLRDSGTLKRDWEECYEWIFLVYAWENIFNTLEISTVGLLKG